MRWTTEQQWHVTLRFLGSVDESAVPNVVAALAAAAAATATPVPVVMGPMTDCFGSAILHVPVSGLDELATQVNEATAAFGEPPDPRPFHGHLTLARSGNRRRRGPNLRRFADQPCSGAWVVEDITLVCSRPHRDGVRYEIVQRTPLGSP